MDDKLLNYYEQELTFIREMGAEFAKKYPKIAGRLLLEQDKCEDPHTERLIEGFAFIASRIYKKIEDDFPQITEAFFNIIYPHYINPFPSMTIVQFNPVKPNISESGYKINKNTTLYSKPVGGTPCQFSTCYPVSLWPVEVESASVQTPKHLVKDAQQAVLIRLKTFNEIPLSDLSWKSIRFFLNGPSQHVYHLYELFYNHVCHIECEFTNEAGKKMLKNLSPGHISPVGFDQEERIIPYQPRSFPGYRLLLEYFSFSEKFLFFDLLGLDKISAMASGQTLDLWIYFNKPAKSNIIVNADTFCLNAVPAINLFSRIAEPIRVDHRKYTYRVIPDIRRQMATEIYSIDKVSASSASSPDDIVEFKPFYSIRHHLEDELEKKRKVFWHIERRASDKKGDIGTDVFLSFSDLSFKSRNPEVEILTVHTTCTNRDLPSRLPFGDPTGDFDMETAAPVASIVCLIKPTQTRRPFLSGELQWRLISHLSLNYLSIFESGEDALKEILKLYDFDNSPVTQQQINGIVSLEHEYITKRIDHSFCRGVQVTITFDETKFVGGGLYLFTCLLERFLAQYVSVNSFTQMIAKTIQKKEVYRKWPPRAGNRILM